METKPATPTSNKIKANGRCFTVVSAIAECWHIKFRHVRRVWFGENREQLVLARLTNIFRGALSDANTQDFEVKLNLICQGKWTPKSIWILTKVFCIFCANLVVLTSIGGALWREQVKNRLHYMNFKLNLTFINSQNNRDLNLPRVGVLHFWSKFGDSTLNEWQVIARTNVWLTHGRTDRRRQRQYSKAKTGLG